MNVQESSENLHKSVGIASVEPMLPINVTRFPSTPHAENVLSKEFRSESHDNTPDNNDASTRSSVYSVEDSALPLPIFLWSTSKTSTTANTEQSLDNTSENILAEILHDAHNRLTSSRSASSRPRYPDIKEKSLNEINATMGNLKNNKTTNPEQLMLELQQKFIDSAKKVFGAFVPLYSNAPITIKFWVAVYSIAFEVCGLFLSVES